MLAVLLGGLAQRETATASALAVVVTVPLAARSRLHHFVSDVISQEELTDALIFAAATRVVLPLMPDRYLGPYGAINPRIIWRIVILMMSISAGGYIAIRLLGPGFGLPIAGLASGFVSSTATRSDGSSRLTAACAGAVSRCRSRVVHDCDHSPDGRCPRRHPSIDAKPDALSSDRSRSGRARLRCVADGLQRMRGRATVRPKRKGVQSEDGRVLRQHDRSHAVPVSGAQCTAGKAGVLAAAAVAGSPTHMQPQYRWLRWWRPTSSRREAVLPILAGLTTNTVSKIAFAISSGGRPLRDAASFPAWSSSSMHAWLAAAFSLGYYN